MKNRNPATLRGIIANKSATTRPTLAKTVDNRKTGIFYQQNANQFLKSSGTDFPGEEATRQQPISMVDDKKMQQSTVFSPPPVGLQHSGRMSTVE